MRERVLTLALLQAFDVEMQSFFYLFTRYLAKRAQAQDLWVPSRIQRVSQMK